MDGPHVQPVAGMHKVAAGCANCYADVLSKRNPQTLGIWGTESQGATRVVAAESAWQQVERWERQAAQSGETIRVFPSLCDPFEDWDGRMLRDGDELSICDGCGKWVYSWGKDCGGVAPRCRRVPRPLAMDDVRARFFRLIDATSHLTWQLLTKRPGNVRSMWPDENPDGSLRVNWESPTSDGGFRPNVHLYASISTQEDADRDLPLLRCRDLVPVLGLSIEPLLGPVDLSAGLWPMCWPQWNTGIAGRSDNASSLRIAHRPFIDHVIVGGESGPNARPCNVEWIRSIVRQCREAGVKCFVKQLGSTPVDTPHELGVAETNHGVDSWRKGGDPSEWPEELRVREMP